MSEGLCRVGEFIIGKRRILPIKKFDVGINDGAERISRDWGLDFVPRGGIEVVMRPKKDGNEHFIIDLERLIKRHEKENKGTK